MDSLRWLHRETVLTLTSLNSLQHHRMLYDNSLQANVIATKLQATVNRNSFLYFLTMSVGSNQLL